MTKLRIATWNINSVRLRAGLVGRFVDEAAPDIVCLQEIKCRNGEFPSAAFEAMGLNYLHVRGQKGWHGVAIASRVPLVEVEEPGFCRADEARVAAVRIGDATGPELHCLYVPAGGDEPDTAINPKFGHKLEFLERMQAHYQKRKGDDLIVVGDINVAPEEHDVWSHKALLNVVSHTPVETDLVRSILDTGGFSDVARMAHGPREKVFSWWSYRSPDWTKNDRGRRLDHIWTGGGATGAVAADSFTIHRHARGWEKPSDHVPVSVDFSF
jgi:exodeoxyribonuclease III